MTTLQKITPFLWFDGKAEEAARFYVTLFDDSRVVSVTPGPDGKALVVRFRLAGLDFLALNGGPHATFNDAVSFSVDCGSQAEVDRLSDALIGETGEQRDCSWLNDRFGVRWQIVPSLLPKYLGDADRTKAARVMQAMMKMKRIDVAALERAYRGE